MSFSLTQLPRDNGVVPLVPGGDGDTRAVGTLGSAIQGTLDTTHCADLVVDPAQVTFLDCAGIGALVADRNTAVISGRCATQWRTSSGRCAGSGRSPVSSARSSRASSRHR
jgi:anti-anti-sigma regulatory factor